MNQLKAGAALSYMAIALNMVIGLIYTPYMLRMLGQSEYGLYSLAASVVAYLTVLDLGFGNAIVRYTAKFRAEGKQREQEEMFGMFFLLYLGIGAVAVVAGAVLAANTAHIFSANMTAVEVERTRVMLWLMTFNLAFTFPMSLWGSIMSAYERFVFQRVVSISRSALNPIVMVVLLAVGYKAVAMVVVTTVFNVLSLLVNFWYCRHKLHIHVRFVKFQWSFLKEVSVYSFWVFLAIIVSRIYWSTGQFVLGIFRGTREVAVFSVAVQLHVLFNLLSTAISSVFLPRVTTMITKGSSDAEISRLFLRTGRVQFIIISYIFTGFIVFGRPFIQLWAGPGYDDVYPITLLFYAALSVPLVQNVGISILQARNNQKFRSLSYVVIAMASLVFSVVGAQLWGIMGCAIATSGALFIGQGLVMNWYYGARQRIDIRTFWLSISRMAVVPIGVATAAMLVVKHFDIDLTHVPSFLAGGASYSLLFGVLFWFFSMNASERELFAAPVRKFLRIRGK